MHERFLADENFPADMADWLRERGHDVDHAAARFPGAADRFLFEVTQREGRILLTLDRDFGDIVFRQKAETPRGVVLFRVPHEPPSLLRTVIRSFFESEPDLAGRFTVVSPGHYRQAPI